jgi:hypothetical protein
MFHQSPLSILKLKILHCFHKNPSPDINGQLLYMIQDGAIKAIMRIAPRPKGSTQKRMRAYPREQPFGLPDAPTHKHT